MMSVTHFPLTLTQEDMYFDQLHYPQNPMYNVGGYIKFGKIDEQKIAQAHRRVVAEHEAFGIRISDNKNGLTQYISENRTIDLPLINFADSEFPHEEADAWLTTLFETSVPVNDCELFKAFLLKISADEYWYVGFAHHLCIDGWGFANWARSIGQSYNNKDIEFIDVPSWQSIAEKDQKYLASEKYQLDKGYWIDHYQDLPEKPLSPQYYSDFENKKCIPSSRKILNIGSDEFKKIQELSEKHNVGVNQLFTAIFAIYFGRLYGKNDLVFGFPSHNRQGHSQKQMISVATSISPLLIHINPELTPIELALQLQLNQKKSYRHQRMPTGHIFQALGLTTGTKSLYDVGINYLKLDSDLSIDGESAELVYLANNHEVTPLMITVWEYGETQEIKIKFDYNHAYFNHQDIDYLLKRIKHLINTISLEPVTRINQLELLPVDERQQLLNFSAAKVTERSKYRGIHQLFEHQVLINPNKIAVTYDDQSLSYQQLNVKANKLARYLVDKGAGRDVRIGLCVKRSPQMIVAMMAILKSGSAYVNLDPSWPIARLNYMVEDASVGLVLTEKGLNQQMSFKVDENIFIDEKHASWHDLSGENPDYIRGQLSPDNLAFVQYTSGSTGHPKGVMIEHGSILAFYAWIITEFTDVELEKVLGSTSFNFDLHLFEVWSALGSGNTLVLVDNILQLMTDQFIMPTLVNTVPSAAEVLVLEGKIPASAKVFNVCGEPLTKALVNNIFASSNATRVFNLYGPSEDTTYSTFDVFYGPIDDTPPIGRQIDNTCAYVLDDQQNLAPVNFTGELYLGGAGLSRGYLDKPELTAEKFVRNHFSTDPQDRLYRTGDLVRWLPDGKLAFIGRKDYQVKLRGFRIELGEIESALSNHPWVKESVVIIPKDSAHLVAYITAKQNDVQIDVLREALQTKLPEYMVPDSIIVLEQMPYLPNRKIDRKALPQTGYIEQTVYIAPASTTEKRMSAIWTNIFELENISVCDDFFSIGGNSLMATRIASACCKEFDKTITVSNFFENKTIKALSSFVDEQESTEQEEIIPLARNKQLPLSSSQQRLLFIQQMAQGDTQYNMPAAFEINGLIDHSALTNSLNEIISRHEILRTTYDIVEGVLTQIIHDSLVLSVSDVNLCDLDRDAQEYQIENLRKNEYLHPFDLKNDNPIRVNLIALDHDRHILLITMHHIAFDGWSVGVFINEFNALYYIYAQGEQASLPTLSIQYADYAHWLENKITGESSQSQLDYWQHQLAGIPQVHSLPLSAGRSTKQDYHGHAHIHQIDSSLVSKIHQLASTNEVSMFMLLESAFAALVSRLSNENDIVIGTPISGRNHHALEDLIGCFVNTLILRSDFSNQPSFNQLLQQTRKTALEAYENQWLPFDVLVDQINPVRSMSHSPLCQLMITYESGDKFALDLPGLTVTPLDDLALTEKFDISLQVTECEHGLSIQWNFASALFSLESIKNMAECFTTLLTEVVASPDEQIGKLSLLGDSKQYLLSCSEGPVDYPQDITIHKLVEQQARTTPDAIALTCNGRHMSYQELDEQANQLANYLIEKCDCSKGTQVGLLSKHSFELIIGMLAVLKVGGAYVPLNPEYPDVRLQYLIDNCQLTTVMCQSNLQARISSDTLNIVVMDGNDELGHYAKVAPVVSVEVKDVAHILYTSGSTGQPKGVMINHLNVVRLLAKPNFVTLNSNTVMLHASSISFDLATFEIWGTLFNGGRLVIHTGQLVDLGSLNNLLVEEQVNTMWMTAGLFDQWSYNIPLALAIKYLLVGGDVVNPQAVKRAYKQLSNASIINGYGPTENTIFASYYAIPKDHPAQRPIPVGIPVNGTGLYLFNRFGVQAGIGEIGELCMTGDGLSPGYYNNQELTDEKFIAQTVAGKEKLLYRSGDLVCWTPEGVLDFIGRVDDQVKIRGFRVELGEIESQINKLENVNHSVVVVQQDSSGKNIIAYVVPTENSLESESDYVARLRGDLRHQLPGFMMPSAFVIIPTLPLNFSGKVDKKSLPKVDISAQLVGRYVAPANEIESKLCVIWQQLLSLEKVGTSDNFFEIGGDSILSIQVVSRANEQGIGIQTKQLFENQTIAELSTCIDENSGLHIVACQDAVRGELDLLPIHRQFLVVDPIDRHHYNQAVLLQTSVEFDHNCLPDIISALFERHDVLRLSFNNTTEKWQAVHRQLDENILATACIIEDLPEYAENHASFIKERCQYWQTSLDIHKGQVIKFIRFNNTDGSGYLFIVAHHLVIDGVSWRILIKDIVLAYNQYSENEAIKLQAKTCSMQQWGSWLNEYAYSDQLKGELSYWLAQYEHPVNPLPVDHLVTGTISNEQFSTVEIKLSREETSTLLRKCNKAYQTQINDLLLSGIFIAFRAWSKNNHLLLTLEGHGREMLDSGLNVNETLGWFTSTFPLSLSSSSDDLGDVIKAIKEQYHAIPNKGLGHGLLLDIAKEASLVEVAAKNAPQVVFNYLGQFDNALEGHKLLSLADIPYGDSTSRKRVREHVLGLNGKVIDGQLTFELDYSAEQFDAQSMEQLAGLMTKALLQVIAHCSQAKQLSYTPSDFPLANLDQVQLDEWQTQYPDFNNLYPATAMQQGMIFHSMMHQGAYVSQVFPVLKGQLDYHFFRQSWKHVVQRHDILRTAFVGRDNILHQLVCATVTLPWFEEDLQHLNAEQQKQHIESYRKADKIKGFDFEQSPLMRMAMFNLGGDRHQLLWTHHHVLLDGWCLPIIYREVMSVYMMLMADQTPHLPQAPHYGDYIKWLNDKDFDEARNFWKQQLSQVETATQIPVDKELLVSGNEGYQDLDLNFTIEQTAELQTFAKQQKTTVNSLYQLAWAYLLHRTSGSDNVVFGATISGRSAEIKGIEQMAGLFINTIPVSVSFNRETNLAEALAEQHKRFQSSNEYGFLPLTDIQRQSPNGHSEALFDSLLVFENYPMNLSSDADSNLPFAIDSFQSEARSNYKLTLSATLMPTLHIKCEYREQQFERETVERLLARFKQILLSFTQPAVDKMTDIDILSTPERQQLATWNQTAVAFDQSCGIHELFELQAKKSPDATALIFDDEETSYQELNEQANQLAHYLISEGVDAGDKVGLSIERSSKMMIALFAILKAGAAYVPLDANYPADRLRYIVQDSGLKLIVTQQKQMNKLSQSFENDNILLLTVDSADVKPVIPGLSFESPLLAKTGSNNQNLAYIIYTSGSTGKPKGVMLSHSSATNYIQYAAKSYLHEEIVGSVVSSPLSFDATITTLFSPLFVGKSVELLADDDKLLEKLADYLADDDEPLLFKITPAHLEALVCLMPENGSSAGHTIIIGGEQLTANGIKPWRETLLPAAIFINEYGPTETVVGCSVYWLEPGDELSTLNVPIGKAIANTQLHVLDSNLSEQGVGATGELFIGGAGLALGYINLPQMTADKFVVSPLDPSGQSRLYRTGDLVRRNAGGELEFLGRADDQVKIRGFRIELGEIESHLNNLDGVKESVVICHINENNSISEKRLVAYFVVAKGVDTDEYYIENIKKSLAAKLPDYMVPSAFVPMTALPLTVNGKVDRKSLPDPDFSNKDSDRYLAPRNKLEEKICKIWMSLLSLQSLGVDDNFFEVGGDSIVSIQVVSRARKANINITTQQLFEYPTVAGLAKCCTQISDTSEQQQEVEGQLKLLPVQQYFLDTVDIDNHHFNQAVLFESPATFKAEYLPIMVSALLSRHDALRLRFYKTSRQQWQAQHVKFSQNMTEQVCVTESIPQGTVDQAAWIAQRSKYWQQQFDLAQGPLMRVVYFKDEQEQSPVHDRLLIIAHHLVIDVMSWRIILADMEQAYSQLNDGHSIALSAKTSSKQTWGTALSEYATSDALMAEKSYWLSQYQQNVPSIEPDHNVDIATLDSSKSLTLSLSPSDTKYLLTECARVYHTKINELLLAGVYLGICQWREKDGVRLLLEGHGREDMFEHIDLSETVGWFTSLYPLTLKGSSSITSEVIMSVKEQYRAIPNNGMGYGLLHYGRRDQEIIDLAQANYPQLCFNYLGQLDQNVKTDNQFRLAQETIGHHISSKQRRLNQLALNGQVLNGQLEFTIDYSEQEYLPETIERLRDCLLAGLNEVIRHCRHATQSRFTPSDFPLASINQSKLDQVASRYPDMSKLYPATVMQQGILFSSLLNASTYMIQVCVDFNGKLNVSLFRQAWQEVIARHDILRTAFTGMDDELHQVVLDKVEVNWDVKDWCELSTNQQNEQFDQYMQNDRDLGFDFELGGLVRMALIRTGEEKYRFMWCHHHILTDGWSSALIYKEVMMCYQSLVKGTAKLQTSPPPYERYVAWLLEQDESIAREYWREQLKSFKTPTQLMVDKLEKDGNHGNQRSTLALSEKQSENLRVFAKNQRTTVNNLLQLAWGYLLHSYSGNQEVVFGVTVSGRTGQLADIENMVGLFINSIPVVMDFSGNTSTRHLINIFHQQFQLSTEYAYVPLSEIIRESKVGSGTPLFDSLLMFANYPMENNDGVEDKAINVDKIWVDDRANFKINLDASLDPNLRVVFGYDAADFATTTIDRMMGHLRQILMSLVDSVDKDIKTIELLSNTEKQQLELWHDTFVDCPLDQSVHQMFEQQVLRSPDAIAVEFEQQTITYDELNKSANKVAHALVEQGIGCDDVVPVLSFRSPEFLIAILGIYKAGGAYLPLDPYSPANRYTKILCQCDAKVVICEQELQDKLVEAMSPLTSSQLPRVLLTNALKSAALSNENMACRSIPDSLAYVLFTSGSTGIPKGAMLENSGLINHLRSKIVDLDLTNESVIAQTASQCFDISVWQFLTAILVGGRISIFTKEQSEDHALLIHRVKTHKVSVLEIVPSLMRMCLDAMEIKKELLPYLQWLIPTGEAVPVPLVSRWLKLYPQVPILNAYGPTECTDDVSLHKVSDVPDENMLSIPIGRPVCNFQNYVLNDNLQQVAVGIIGELYIGGMGVGRGYLRDARKTAMTFIPDLFSGVAGSRMYKTGDLVRRLSDGSLDFIGRIDQQVKIRGLRIELGEIESQLVQLDILSAAVVITRGEDSDMQLVAYVIAHLPQAGFDIVSEFNQVIVTGLKQQLPEYMVPAIIVEMEEFPLNRNGKVDRKSLPEVVFDSHEDSFVYPETEIEAQLLPIWCELLGLEQISVEANFFEKGGHSLLAMRLKTNCSAEFNTDVSLLALYENSTIRSLALHIQSLEQSQYQGIQAVARKDLMPLSYGQQSLWLIDHLSGGSSQYNIPAAYEITGELDADLLHLSLDELIARHEILRTTYTSMDGEGFQVIHGQASCEIAMVDLTGLDKTKQSVKLEQMKAEEAAMVFDLSKDFPIRARLISLEPRSHILLFTLHHIASDAWSVSIMMKEFMSFYKSFSSGIEFDLPPLAIQYADYASWQRDNIAPETLEKQLQYWVSKLDGVPKLHNLTTDFSRPPEQDYLGQTYVQRFDLKTRDGLNKLASQKDVSLFMLLQTAFSLLVGQLSDETDIVIGSPVAGRTKKEVDPLIGYFVNALILRTDLSGDPRFTDLLAVCRNDTLQSFDYQDMPFEMLVDGLQPDRSLSHSPIFQLVFSLQNTENAEFDFHDLTIKDISNEDVNAKFDLVLNAEEHAEGIDLHWIFARSLFDSKTIMKMATCFEALLAIIITRPQDKLSEIKEGLSSELAPLTQHRKKSKISGYAIDLAKIEAHLDNLPGVKQARVICANDGKSEQMVAYLVEQGEIEADVPLAQRARVSLSKLVPDYMIPKIFMTLDKLPLDERGQLIIAALPQPDFSLAGGYIAPQTDTEIKLAAIWQDILAVDNIGATDSFFSLGGQSLTAVRMLVEIKDAFDMELALRDIFQHQTVAEMACLIDNEMVKKQNINIANESEDLFEIEI